MSEAHNDIREGRVHTFNSPDEMIASLHARRWKEQGVELGGKCLSRSIAT